LELYQLRSFVAVAEAGHLTRAADRLHISQPAVSAQIKALEEELEVELFQRRSSGMALTAAGKRLLGEAQKLLSAAQALRNEARAIKGEVAGVARVGTVSDAQFTRLGALTSAAVERHPGIELQLQHEVTGAAFEKVRDGELDASFYYGELAHPGISGLVLRDVVYRIAAPAAWRERIGRAAWSDIAAEPWIMTPAISTHHQLASALFQAHHIAPAKVVEADDEFVVGSLIEAGLGVALMREDIAIEKAGTGAVCLWQEVRLKTCLRFLYLAERESDPVIRALVDTLEDVWQLRGSRVGGRPRCAASTARSAPAPSAGARTASSRPAPRRR
jgi:DNA-binding transcriptional LysR family regulator